MLTIFFDIRMKISQIIKFFQVVLSMHSIYIYMYVCVYYCSLAIKFVIVDIAVMEKIQYIAGIRMKAGMFEPWPHRFMVQDCGSGALDAWILRPIAIKKLIGKPGIPRLPSLRWKRVWFSIGLQPFIWKMDGNGWVTLSPCLCAAEFSWRETKQEIPKSTSKYLALDVTSRLLVENLTKIYGKTTSRGYCGTYKVGPPTSYK